MKYSEFNFVDMADQIPIYLEYYKDIPSIEILSKINQMYNCHILLISSVSHSKNIPKYVINELSECCTKDLSINRFLNEWIKIVYSIPSINIPLPLKALYEQEVDPKLVFKILGRREWTLDSQEYALNIVLKKPEYIKDIPSGARNKQMSLIYISSGLIQVSNFRSLSWIKSFITQTIASIINSEKNVNESNIKIFITNFKTLYEKNLNEPLFDLLNSLYTKNSNRLLRRDLEDCLLKIVDSESDTISLMKKGNTFLFTKLIKRWVVRYNGIDSSLKAYNQTLSSFSKLLNLLSEDEASNSAINQCLTFLALESMAPVKFKDVIDAVLEADNIKAVKWIESFTNNLEDYLQDSKRVIKMPSIAPPPGTRLGKQRPIKLAYSMDLIKPSNHGKNNPKC
jgi:hypothetical protein